MYDLPVDGDVELNIYDISGKFIKALVNDFKPAGNYSISFNASELPSGVYLYTLKASGYTKTLRMAVIK